VEWERAQHAVYDVCVVGAGSAGIACAQGLALQGRRVLLLDRADPQPPTLKAEKLDGEGVQALLRLGLDPAVTAALTPLRRVGVYFGRRYLATLEPRPAEAGFLYHTLVNQLRACLDPRIDFQRGTRVAAVETTADGPVVVTGTGDRVACRLVVLATGEARGLVEACGAVTTPVAPYTTFVVAASYDGSLHTAGRPVDALTFHHPIPGGPVAYATFFRVGHDVRANVFCPGPLPESWAADLQAAPTAVLAAGNPRIAALTEGWTATSPITSRKVHVFQLTPPDRTGLVVLGDAGHVIDPAGGGGLVFALLEVELFLREYAPAWLTGATVPAPAIATYYADPRRRQAVDRFFGAGRYIFDLNHDASLRGRRRRWTFILRHRLARVGAAGSPTGEGRSAWPLPAPYLYEQFAQARLARERVLSRG